MSEDQGRELEERQSPHRTVVHDAETAQSTTQDQDFASPYPASLLGDMGLSGRGNRPVRTALIQQLQRTHGNRAVQRMLERREGAVTDAPETEAISEASLAGYESSGNAVVQRTPAAPSGPSGTAARDQSKIRIDPIPDIAIDDFKSSLTVNPHVIDPAVKHMTWEIYDPSDKMLNGSFSTAPTSPKATTEPFPLDPSMFSGGTATEGKYRLRLVGLNDKHQPIVYMDRDFNVTKTDLKTNTPVASTYGELTFTKYDKTDASSIGGSWSVDVELKFLPKSTVASDDIVFMQAAQSLDSSGKSLHRFANAEVDARQTPLAWSIDRVAGAPSPFYIAGRDSAGKTVDVPGWGKKGKGGATPSEATLKDKPSWNKESNDRFESCAICRSGPNKGQVYGCATWGYSVDNKGQVTLMPRTFHQMPSEEFVEARAAWNTWRSTVPAATRPDEAPDLKSP